MSENKHVNSRSTSKLIPPTVVQEGVSSPPPPLWIYFVIQYFEKILPLIDRFAENFRERSCFLRQKTHFESMFAPLHRFCCKNVMQPVYFSLKPTHMCLFHRMDSFCSGRTVKQIEHASEHENRLPRGKVTHTWWATYVWASDKSFVFIWKYSQSSPCDHSRKRPALVTTNIVKPHLTCHLNSVMKSSRKGCATAPVSDGDHFCELPTGFFLCF